jgi:Ca2+-binding EF-hand superfamily protein
VKRKRLAAFVNTYQENKQIAVAKYSGQKLQTKGSLFRALDVDGDGYLSKQELRPFAKRIGIKLDSLMARMDTKRDGKVSRAEFRAFMRNILS